MKILVVDDSSAMRKIITGALAKTSFKDARIVEATNGKEAFDKFVDDSFGLILSDWNMPEMDGLEFVTKVRRGDRTVKILMITTEGTMGKMEEALDQGVNGYIVKPFTPETLDRKITAVMRPAAKKA